MKVNLLDIDSRIPNLALMKISAYHKAKGDEVFINFPICNPDMTYASCIFTKNKGRVPPDVVAGGPGYDLKSKLPKWIEECKPDYSLYLKIDYSLGYTYRYCPRKCSFCNVWKMGNERGIHHSIYSFLGKRFKRIRILNNNTFADPFWKDTFTEIHKENLIAHFDQGFDIRLLDEEKARWLKWIKHHKQIYFAFDNIRLEKKVRQGIKLLKDAGHKLSNIAFFVLTGFDSVMESDMERVNILRGLGVDPYIMLYDREKTPRLLREYSRWVNMKWAFKKYTFEEFLRIRKYRSRKEVIPNGRNS